MISNRPSSHDKIKHPSTVPNDHADDEDQEVGGGQSTANEYMASLQQPLNVSGPSQYTREPELFDQIPEGPGFVVEVKGRQGNSKRTKYARVAQPATALDPRDASMVPQVNGDSRARIVTVDQMLSPCVSTEFLSTAIGQ